MSDPTAAGAATSQHDAWVLLESLPDTLPRDEILAINSSKSDIHTQRTYTYNGWTFQLPPGVLDWPPHNSALLRDEPLLVPGAA
ncbi:hypothetical protein ACWDX6_05780 [Streptomyces sp. NPDC003027]